MKKRLELDFAINDNARVLTTVVGNSIYLDRITNEVKMDCTNLDNAQIEGCIKLNFYKTESVERVIEALEKIKIHLMMISAS